MWRTFHSSFVISGIVIWTLVSGRATAPPPSPGQTGSAAMRSELITVTSKDGTRIGVECAGTGPTLLFVHGGVGDRTRWTPMFPLLTSRFTACAMDRRGRGASGDSAEYSLLKEAEDVAAVVNSRSGSVFVFGHSYGGVAALEATYLTDRIARLMLYEPPLHEPVDNNLAVATRLDALIKKRELEQAFVTFQAEIVKQSPEEIARMKARPTWTRLVDTIALHPRQMRALAAYRFDATRIESMTVPTLLLIGEDTASPFAKQSIAALRKSLPNSTLVVLEGQEHNAMDGARAVLADAIIKFTQETGAVSAQDIRITLLGTASGPRAFADKAGISTLVEAGGERLLFDAGRGFMQRLVQAGLPMNAVTKLFLTHLHSDHVIGVPDLMLTPWAAAPERKVPLEVWGPDGTRDMMRHLEEAFAFDIHMRRDVDESFSPDGIRMAIHDIREGKVYEKNGVTVTAFVVTHGRVKPSYGYRVDYSGRSVALSGDTSPSDTLVAACKGVDVLIHEAIDVDVLRRLVSDKTRVDAIVARHTTPEQAATIFNRVSPRLAVFSHSPGTAAITEQTRRSYSGRVEMGEDLMVIDIGAEVIVKRAAATSSPR